MGIKQFGRRGSLILVAGERGLDLSEFRFTFQTQQQDVESPSNCRIRVYNLADSTIKKIRGEFARVVLQAGYEDNFGVIFDGTIKQFGIGRENGTDTYLDILAADGDLAYNYATVNKTLAAQSSHEDRVKVVLDAMADKGVTAGYLMPATGGTLPRGKVLFGMARAILRQEVQSIGASWSINNGKVQILPLDGYLPGEIVVLNSQTGMVGMPVQTIDGIKVRSLLNPKLVIGGLLQIDNKSINQIAQAQGALPNLAYNQYAGVQNLATTTTDGIYRMFIVEHQGDSRGQAWWSDITGLAVDPDTKKVKAKE